MRRRDFMTCLAGAMVAPAAANAATFTDGSIKVGQSAPFSGPSAALGLEMEDGMEACFAAVNRAGGIFGRPIEYIRMDDGYDPERTLDNVHKMISAGVFGFCGFVGTPTSLRVLPVVTAARIPFVGAFTGAQALRTPMNRYVFNVRAGYDLEAKKIVRQLTSFGDGARIGLFIQSDAYGDAVRAAVQAALEERGLPGPVAIATVPRNAEGDVLDFAVAKAVEAFKAAGVTGIALGTVYGACTRLVQALNAAHLFPMLASVSFVGTSNLLNCGNGARGICVAQVMPAPMYPTTQVIRDYIHAIHACGKTNLTYGGVEGFVAGCTFIEGLHRCGPNRTRERFVSGLEAPLDIGGLVLNFSATDHNPSHFVEMVQISEGPSGPQIVR